MDGIDAPRALESAEKRSFWYWYRDGINEIGSGVGALGIVGLMYMIHHMEATDGTEWGAVAVGITGLIVSFFEGPLKRRLRERLTYPRLGYLSEKGGEPLARRRKVLIFVMMAVLIVLPVVITALLLTGGLNERAFFAVFRWMPCVAGPGMLATVVAASSDIRRFGLQRLWIGGLVLGLAGPAISLSISAPALASAVFFLVYSLVNIISGSAALASLVRTVPVAE